MTFSYTAIWEDTIRLIRERLGLFAAIAGAFIFLPALLIGHLLPAPQPPSPEQALASMIDYYRQVWPYLFAQSLLSMVGTAAMMRLVFARANVGEAIVFGVTILPFYFVLSLVSGLMVGFGTFLLILPGLYLVGRLTPAVAALVAEGRRSPFDAIQRSFALTRGRGWAVFGLLLLVVLVAWIAIAVLTSLVGIVFVLLAGPALGGLLTLTVISAATAALSILLLSLYCAIYRALAGQGSETADVFA